MARIRYLKPDFFTDEDLAELPFETRLLFAGLWCYADRDGRLEDRPKYLKAMIFPYDDVDVEAHLNLLTVKKQFIVRYEVDGKSLIEIPTWSKHQSPHHTERASIFPPHTPLSKDKDKIKIKIKRSVHEATPRLRNGERTVNEPLKEFSDEFLMFYGRYPRKIGRDGAWKAWQKKNGGRPTIDVILSAIDKQKAWRDNAQPGEFRPEWKHPATWINQGCWADEVEEEQKSKWFN